MGNNNEMFFLLCLLIIIILVLIIFLWILGLGLVWILGKKYKVYIMFWIDVKS